VVVVGLGGDSEEGCGVRLSGLGAARVPKAAERRRVVVVRGVRRILGCVELIWAGVRGCLGGDEDCLVTWESCQCLTDEDRRVAEMVMLWEFFRIRQLSGGFGGPRRQLGTSLSVT
jgi:hypothetical protein